jgi:hypothetical protein
MVLYLVNIAVALNLISLFTIWVILLVYTYEGWTLYVIEPEFKAIGKRKMYFFSKRTPNRGSPCDKPSHMVVGVNKRTGLPYLKNASGKSLHQTMKKMKNARK